MKNSPFNVLDPIIYAGRMVRVYWKWLLSIYVLSMVPSYIVYVLQYWAFMAQDTVHSNVFGIGILGPLLIVINLLFTIFVIAVWFPAAYTHISLSVYDGKPFDMRSIVSSISAAPSMMAILLLLVCFYSVIGFFLLTLFFYVPVVAIIASILTALLLVWLHVRILFSTFFIVDKGYRAKEALLRSYELTRGRFWLLWCVRLFISIFTLLAALLVVAGIMSVLAVIGYLSGKTGVEIGSLLIMIGNPFYMFIATALVWLADGYMYRKLGEYRDRDEVAPIPPVPPFYG